MDDAERARLDADAVTAGDAAAARVGASLREFFSTPPDQQRTTPLEIVRTATREVTEVLAAAGIPPVERDDEYDVTPATLADLGDDELGPLQLAWGLAKAKVLRADAERRS